MKTISAYFASKIMTPYLYWLDNNVKILQFSFLRPSLFDLKTDENHSSFLSTCQEAYHHSTQTTFLKDKKPKTSKLHFHQLNIHITIYHDQFIYVRNYDPIRQYFCLLPYNHTSRTLIVSQEQLVHFDDFLLHCNVPTTIVKPPVSSNNLCPFLLMIKESHIKQLC